MKALLRRISLFVILIGFMAAAAVMLLLDPDPDAGTIFLVITSFALVSALMGTWLVLPLWKTSRFLFTSPRLRRVRDAVQRASG